MQRCMEKFSTYMHDWLYAKEGYYATHNTIGKEGDFYTAVSSSMFFGGSIAKRALKSIDEFLGEETYIVEVGAHKGYLLADIIQFIYTLRPELLKTLSFCIVEPFKSNQEAQKQYFQDSFGNEVELLHVKSFNELTCKSAFVVANEIFDAFSCEVIKDDKMLYIEKDDVSFDTLDEKMKQLATKYRIKQGEVALGYEAFASDMFQAIEKFDFVTFDYGQKGSRGDFSLRIYEKHQVYPFFSFTPFVPKSQRSDKKLSSIYAKADITYDVNFEHLIGAFEQAGIKLQNFAVQMQALVDFGLIELLEMLKKNVSEEQYTSELNRVKTLIDPAFLGERFKMCHFRKEVVCS